MARKRRHRPELEREGQIRCRYCGGFYDPSLAQCPNCGNETEENQSYTTDWRHISPEECAGGFGGADHLIRKTASWLAGALAVLFLIISITGIAQGVTWSAKQKGNPPAPAASSGDTSAEPDASAPAEPDASASAEPDTTQTEPKKDDNKADTTAEPEAIVLNYTDVTMRPEEELELEAEVTPKDWKGTVEWSTDDQYVAWVSQSGKVICMGGGSCLITAKAGTKTVTCQVRCTGAAADHTAVDTKVQELERQEAKDKLGQIKKNPPQTDDAKDDTKDDDKPDDQDTDESLTLSLTDLTLMAVGHTYQFEVTGGDGNYTWSSAGEWVATVDQNGVVTGVGQGMATITCTDGSGKSAECIVHVL